MPSSVTYNMDCLEAMRQMPDKCFDLAVVDPPYGLSISSTTGSGKLKTRALNKGNIKRWDTAPTEEYFEQLFRVSENQIIFGGNYFKLPSCRGFIVWDKLQPWENFSRCEFAWTSFDMPSRLFAFDNRTGGKIHPTQKPVALYVWIYSKYAKPSNKILDSHLGSGSSRIAAYDAGLDFVGFEIDEGYYKAQEKRFAAHTAQTSLFVADGVRGGTAQQ